jgi:hypothetical protein
MHWPRPTQGSEPSPNSPHYTSCFLRVRKFCQENSESRNTSRGCEASWCSGGACCSLVSRHTRVGMCPVYSASSASCAIHGKILEIHTALAAHYLSVVAQVKSAQSGTASTPDANPGRPTVSTPRLNWLSTIRDWGTFRRTLNGIFEGLRNRPSHQVICPSAVGAALAE